MVSAETIASEVLKRAGTALNGLVGERVYFGVAPAGFANNEAAVVFRTEGGSGALWSPVKERSFLLECWGGDAEQGGWLGAAAVYEAVNLAWHDTGKVTVASGVMMQGYEEMGGVPLVHPDTKLEYYVCRMAGKFRGA